METQTLIIGKRRFVVVPEREFLKLQRQATESEVRRSFGEQAMRDLEKYRTTGKAANWNDVKQKLGL